jgi:hypothetical protein
MVIPEGKVTEEMTKIDFTNYVVDMELTQKFEPDEGSCSICRDCTNLFMYHNKVDNLYLFGCCLCDGYGEPKSTPVQALLDWADKYYRIGERF